jgi:DNA-binding IclR family transcriptional regulator
MAIRDSAGTPFASISVSSIMARMTGVHLQSVLAIMGEEVAKISAKLSKMRPIGRA